MAIVRRNFAVLDAGRCVCWIEWDDQASRRWITRGGVDNASAQPVLVRGTVIADPTRTFEQVVAAGTSWSQDIPTSAAARLQFFVNANGKLDGISLEAVWPAP